MACRWAIVLAARQDFRLGSIWDPWGKIAVGRRSFPGVRVLLTEAARALAGRVATEGISTAERAVAQARKQFGLLSFGHANHRHHRSSAAGQTLGVPKGPARYPARAMASPLSSMDMVAGANERSGWPSLQRLGTALGRGGTRQRHPGAANRAGGWQYAGKDKAVHHHLAPHHLHRRGGQVKPAAKVGGKLGKAKRLIIMGPSRAQYGCLRKAGQGIKWNQKAVRSGTIASALCLPP